MRTLDPERVQERADRPREVVEPGALDDDLLRAPEPWQVDEQRPMAVGERTRVQPEVGPGVGPGAGPVEADHRRAGPGLPVMDANSAGLGEAPEHLLGVEIHTLAAYLAGPRSFSASWRRSSAATSVDLATVLIRPRSFSACCVSWRPFSLMPPSTP